MIDFNECFYVFLTMEPDHDPEAKTTFPSEPCSHAMIACHC